MGIDKFTGTEKIQRLLFGKIIFNRKGKRKKEAKNKKEQNKTSVYLTAVL